MHVSEILDAKGHEVITIEPDRGISDATAIMVDNRISALVVTDQRGGIVGIVSERDITRGLRQFGAALPNKRVRDLMTQGVITCAPDHRVDEIMTLMASNSIRHLPVVLRGRLAGIISIRDVMGNNVRVLKEENQSLRNLLVALK